MLLLLHIFANSSISAHHSRLKCRHTQNNGEENAARKPSPGVKNILEILKKSLQQDSE